MTATRRHGISKVVKKEPIDLDALRAEMERLKTSPDVRAYHRTKAQLMGASGRGQCKARPQKKKVDATAQ